MTDLDRLYEQDYAAWAAQTAKLSGADPASGFLSSFYRLAAASPRMAKARVMRL
jgi:hypothetical protein